MKNGGREVTDISRPASQFWQTENPNPIDRIKNADKSVTGLEKVVIQTIDVCSVLQGTPTLRPRPFWPRPLPWFTTKAACCSQVHHRKRYHTRGTVPFRICGTRHTSARVTSSPTAYRPADCATSFSSVSNPEEQHDVYSSWILLNTHRPKSANSRIVLRKPHGTAGAQSNQQSMRDIFKECHCYAERDTITGQCILQPRRINLLRTGCLTSLTGIEASGIRLYLNKTKSGQESWKLRHRVL